MSQSAIGIRMSWLSGLLFIVSVPVICQVKPDQSLRSLNGLTGPGFKVIEDTGTGDHYLRIGLQGGIFLPQKPGNNAFGSSVTDSITKVIFNDPILFEALYEQLGGEFLVGKPSGESQVEKVQLSSGFQYGLTVDAMVSPRINLSLGYRHRRHDLSGEFPVTIFPADNDQPYLTQGNLSSGVIFNTLELKSNYIHNLGKFSPYAGLGLLWQWQKKDLTNVELEDEHFSLGGSDQAENYPRALVNGGVSVYIFNFFHMALDIQYSVLFEQSDGIKGGGTSFSIVFFWNVFNYSVN